MATFQDRTLTVEVRWQEAGVIIRVQTPDGRSAQVAIPRALAPNVGAELWPEMVETLRDMAETIEIPLCSGMATCDPEEALKMALKFAEERANKAKALLATPGTGGGGARMSEGEANTLGESLGVTETDPRPYRWRAWCSWCRRRHIVTMRPCPTCGVTPVPRPASARVAETCKEVYQCDGCRAYAGRYQ